MGFGAWCKNIIFNPTASLLQIENTLFKGSYEVMYLLTAPKVTFFKPFRKGQETVHPTCLDSILETN